MTWANAQPRSRTWVAEVKRRAGYRCQIRWDGCTGQADVADHITPIAEGGSVDDLANGQGACSHCHDIKTLQEAARGRQRVWANAKHPREQHPGLKQRGADTPSPATKPRP